MRPNVPGIRNPLSLIAASALCVVSAAAAAQANPDELLDKMAHVVSVIDYEGTVVRQQNGESETLKVVRKIIDGVINEKLVTQEGNGLEIIRIGNEVHCILPDKQTVLIEAWNNQSTLFSALPSSDIRYGADYDVLIVSEDRVAGRRAIELAVRPHDEFRYGHRIWLDQETSFPLKTEMVGVDGELIEQIKFADVRLGSGIARAALEPTMSLDNYSWYKTPGRIESGDVDTAWVSADLPSGFKVLSSKSEQLPGSDAPVTHIVFGDGMASVSVFIAARHEAELAERSSVGTSSAYSLQQGDYQITAVGEVPPATVRRIATSMRRN